MRCSKIGSEQGKFMSDKKAGLASLSQGRSDLHSIDPRVIKIKEGWNCRDTADAETKEHIERLALSIAENWSSRTNHGLLGRRGSVGY